MKPQTSLSFLSVGIQMCAHTCLIILCIMQTTQACGSVDGVGVNKFGNLAVLEGGGFWTGWRVSWSNVIEGIGRNLKGHLSGIVILFCFFPPFLFNSSSCIWFQPNILVFSTSYVVPSISIPIRNILYSGHRWGVSFFLLLVDYHSLSLPFLIKPHPTPTVVLENKPRALYTLSKCSIFELYAPYLCHQPQLQISRFIFWV